MKNMKIIILTLILLLSISCTSTRDTKKVVITEVTTEVKAEPQIHVAKWFDSATIYEVNIRQYTEEGTFSAFAEHLPRLQDLGVEILWFMPIHPISVEKRKGTLGSYYAVSDYKGINPEFGTTEDFKLLIQRCHEMGMRVILDWVPNHTGWDNKWISSNPEWYTQENGKIIHPSGTDWTDVADLNYDNIEMRAAMIDSMSYWVTDFDIDGFRCDVAGSVPSDFWEDASENLNSLKPLFMLAEDSSNYSFLKKSFNSNYNWALLNAMDKASDGNGNKSSVKSIIRYSISRYPFGSFPMNFITNHDENSWNNTAFNRFGDAKNMLTALTFIMPGMPLIYSGQEASLNKQLLFFEKDEIDWSNLEHQDFLKSLIDIKKRNSSLYNGSAGGNVKFLNSTDKSVLTFIRAKDENRVIFISNFNKEDREFNLREFQDMGTYIDALTGETIELSNETTFYLKGFDFKIFVK